MAKAEKTDRSVLKSGKAPESKGLKKAKAAPAEGEICYGCGSLSSAANPHPVVGVLNRTDLDDGWTVLDNDSPGEDGETYVGVPVCDACWRNPEHRSAHPLKVHFFERKGNSAKVGLLTAGSFGIGG